MCIIAAMSFSIINIISLKKEQYDVQKQQEELKKEKKQLEKELDNINDPENLEEQARNQLRLVKPGETLYMFSDDITENNDSDSTSESEKK